MTKHIKQGLVLAASLLAVLPAHFTLAQTLPPVTQILPPTAQTSPDDDNRRGISTRPNERVRILTNMRKYLVGLQWVTEALARDDMQAAIAAVRTMGAVNLYDIKLMFPNKASVEFHNLAFEVHSDFDAIARDAEAKKDPKLMLAQIGTVMKKCTHCHETYRLQDSAH
ncbi:hypothetical protein [Polaromonas sp.]|uniref:hypothetical protein n=1 Tax=Polaromonas sp. TaxID=1869339 RepID=UPI0017B4D280|nr:hypothetical protein [Polaromonas sp.]NMM04777.1 cytochrome c [Polaromonas sp.]